MRKAVSILSVVTYLTMTVAVTGCSVQTGDVSAKAGRTEGTEVAELKIPYDPKKPKIALVVEPFIASQSVVTWTNDEGGAVPIGDKMAAQLITALSKVGNFVLYDSRSTKKVSAPPKGKGPYYITAVLTELNENAEAEADSKGASLGGLGVLAGIAGAVTGNRGLGWTGFGLAVANPTYQKNHAKRKGVVAFDAKIVEKSTGRIITSFESAGTFTSESEAVGASLFGIGGSKAVAASSALGQALRVAMNDAVQKSADELLQ
jgi:curli biogenesis system outer membrane secretion channel CsgG